jgi:hypothetical protein
MMAMIYHSQFYFRNTRFLSAILSLFEGHTMPSSSAFWDCKKEDKPSFPFDSMLIDCRRTTRQMPVQP